MEDLETLPGDQRARLADHGDLGEYVEDLASRLNWVADAQDGGGDDQNQGRKTLPYVVAGRTTLGASGTGLRRRTTQKKEPGPPRAVDAPSAESVAKVAPEEPDEASSSSSKVKFAPDQKRSSVDVPAGASHFDFTSVEQLKSIFNSVDINGDGQLDPTELQQVFKKCGRDFITETVIEEFIDDFDEDGEAPARSPNVVFLRAASEPGVLLNNLGENSAPTYRPERGTTAQATASCPLGNSSRSGTRRRRIRC